MKLAILLLLITTCSFSQEFDRLKNFNIKGGIAVEGYDVVSYFDGKPQKGSSKFYSVYKGVGYHFSSDTNLKKFKSNPEKYEPQFGGWCAYAIGNSAEKVKIDPETFTIIDNKLYLFYNFFFTNTLELWKENESELLIKANANWRKITVR